jgi:phage-related protein (TIGR01555 family)
VMNWFRPRDKAAPAPAKKKDGFFSSDHFVGIQDFKKAQKLADTMNLNFQKPLPVPVDPSGLEMAMDGEGTALKANFRFFRNNIPDAILDWFGDQGFIGYQLCSIIAQHWLVLKAIRMPARDAVRKGWETTVTDGTDIPPDVLDQLKKIDERMKLKENLVEFVSMGRTFGLRIAIFVVESPDPFYYEKPFNPDGVTPGSYKGISQVDPYWVTPILDFIGASDPADKNFYEPLYWTIGGRKYHRSHLCIFRGDPVADALKPSYLYGGISVPQKIYERVYNAERTANEVPLLALTKRTTTIHTDTDKVTADPEEFERKMAIWIHYRDNHGIKVLGEDETMEQFDTSLSDLDAVVMTAYQLVASASGVPATKLLGTSPKGFNTTGEGEESSYHEELETIQTHDMTPMITRHHMCAIRSEIVPDEENQIAAPFETGVNWYPLDAPTATERATINLTKAQTDASLVQAGAIDGIDVRERLIADPESGYSGLELVDMNDQTDEEIAFTPLIDPNAAILPEANPDDAA